MKIFNDDFAKKFAEISKKLTQGDCISARKSIENYGENLSDEDLIEKSKVDCFGEPVSWKQIKENTEKYLGREMLIGDIQIVIADDEKGVAIFNENGDVEFTFDYWLAGIFQRIKCGDFGGKKIAFVGYLYRDKQGALRFHVTDILVFG